MAVTTINLTTASIEVDKFNGTLSARESGALSAYNSDMKKLIRKVKKLPDYTDDTYYIMLVAKSDNPALGGFMPVNSNFGFVFAQANSGAEQMNRTIAHELAHGAFRLWHTFSSENLYTAQQGTTRNLMDYNGTNSELYKYQWDYIHNPQEGIVRWMVDEDESEMNDNDALVAEILKAIHDANTKQENHCKIESKGVGYITHNYNLGDKTIEIEIVKQNFGDLTIDCTKNNCATETCDFACEREGSFVKFIYSSYGDDKKTDAFVIAVDDKYAKELAEYLFPYISTKQLHNIYPNASAETIKAVTEAINKYCNEFEINTPERMAHFLGQIGVETGGKLEKGVESCDYSADRIRDIFAKRIKGSVIEHSTKSISLKALTNPDLYSGLSMEESKYYFSVKQIENEKKELIWVVDNTDTIYEKDGNTFIEHTDLSINSYYTNGANNCALFNYVYCCDKSGLGNNSYESGDGSFFRGRGFIQLTGRNNYTKIFYEPWKRSHPDDTRGLKELVELISDNIDISVYVSMRYWEYKAINDKIGSSGYSDSEVETVTKKVNGGKNGIDKRKDNTKKAYEELIK